MTIKIHFDGKNFVPDEPVNFPVDTPLVAEIRPAKKKKRAATLKEALGLLKTNGPAPTDDEVRRVLAEELLRKHGG